MRSIKLQILLFAIGFFTATAAWSKTVDKIDLTGNRRIENQVVLNAMALKPGAEFSRPLMNKDLKAIFKLGFFEDVKLSSEDTAKGVVIHVVVKERPVIRSIDFRGNDKIETDKLQNAVKIELYTTLDETKASRAINDITKIYEAEGYYLVGVHYRIQRLEDNYVSLIFEIDEKKPVKIKKITFLGIKHLSDRKIRKSLESKKANLFSFVTKSGHFDREIVNNDVLRIIHTYHDHGFLDVKVSKPQTYLSPDKRSVFLTFHITEGEPYTVRKIDIQGDLLFPKEVLLKGVTLEEGKVFNRSTLEHDLQTITEKYSDEGYFYANVRNLEDKDEAKKMVDVTLSIDKGLQVYFERINITGNNITRDKVVRRELLMTEGELFSLTKLKKSIANVKRLGYFEEVNPSTPRASADDKIDLNLDVKEKPTGTFTIGAGFSSVDKFLFNAEIAKDNFLGYGIRGEVSAQIGGTRQLFNMGLTEPSLFDSPYSVGLNAFRQDVEYPSFDRKSIGAELQVGRKIIELVRGSIAYRFEDVNIGNVDASVQSFFQDGVTSTGIFTLTRDARDNAIFPRKGTYNSLSLQLAGGPLLGGDNEFFKVLFNTRFFYPIWKDIIFRAQGRFGYIGSVTGKEPPIFERFFLGGINSIRGFRSRSIGPTRQVASLDPASPDYEFLIGGNKELIFNVEVGFPIVPQINLQGVVFFDAGNAYDDGQTLDFTDMRTSTGFGVRWLSPLGPLRFEYGFPINKKPGDKKSAFEFTIGTSF